MLKADFSNINKNDVVAVALSGGEDSVTLLHVLLENAESLGCKVKAISVEHGIRGETSKKDLDFCVDLCSRLNVEIKTTCVNAPAFAKKNGYSLEQAARVLRYDFFYKCIDEGFCDKVAVAHHLSDRAETILFNVLRGSSLSGAKGISNVSDDGRIIRPLLNVTKDEISAYRSINGLKFVTDESNFDVNFTRNALRLNIIPQLETYFPRAEDSIVRFGESCRADDEYLYSLAETVLEKRGSAYYIDAKAPYPVFSRAAILALKRSGVEKDYQKSHVDALFALASNQTGRQCDLPLSVLATKVHDHVVIERKKPDNRLIAPFTLGDIPYGDIVVSCKKIDKNDVVFGDGLYFDLDKLQQDAVFRPKQDGDVFTKFDGSTVSLKKFLTDKKVALPQKKRVVVLAKEKIVYLIVNLEISSLIKIDKASINVVKLTCSSTKE